MIKEKQGFGYIFIVCASIVIVLAGIKSATVIIVPFLLSLFIAIILSPAYRALLRYKIPSVVALIAVLGVFMIVVLFVAKLFSSSAVEFSTHMQEYAQKFTAYYRYIIEFAHKIGYEISVETLTEMLDVKQLMRFISSMVQGMGSLFTNGFVVILTVAFMLLESDVFVKKIKYISAESVAHIDDIFEKIKHYMVIKSAISLLTAVIIYIALRFTGTDFPLLWAVLAFLLNFIPNIGSILAAVPAVLITLVQFGFGSALVVSLVYIGVNIIIGSILEPKIMGKGLGVSTLVVFLSLIFWGWLLGITGMFLSIPLTIMAKIIFSTNETTRPIAIFLSDASAVDGERN